MNNNISKKLNEFVIKHRFQYNFPLTKDKLLWKDLGIYGDDAVEFFTSFSNEFNIDVSNFELSKYFKGEGQETFSFVLNFFKQNKTKDNYIPITLGDLDNGLLLGRLDDAVISNNK